MLINCGFIIKYKHHIPQTITIKLNPPKNAEAIFLPNPADPSATP